LTASLFMNDPTSLPNLEFSVQILRHIPNRETRVLEPWPIATAHITQSGEVHLIGSASKAYGPMQQAFEAVLTAFAKGAAAQIQKQLTSKADASL
jgi:hypothetical protein